MSKEAFKTAKVVGAIAGARMGATFFHTLLLDHRDLSHGSVKVSKRYRRVATAEQRTASVTPELWASNHQPLHHQWTDMDAYPFWKAYQLMKLAEKRGLPVPESFQGYDRGVPQFSAREVFEIGTLADQHLKVALVEQHKPPDFSELSDSQILDYLTDVSPKYMYDRALLKKKGDFTDEEKAHISLRDQHSTALAPNKRDGSWNGVQFVLMHDLALNGLPSRLFRQNPELMPEHLRPQDGLPLKTNEKYVWAGFGLTAVLALILSRDFTKKGMLKAAFAGSLGNGLGLGFLEKGAASVNALGHSGPNESNMDLLKAIFAKNYELKINFDGSYATDLIYSGELGQLLSRIVGDESGLQWGHHMHPEAVAYPDSEGNVSWKNAPTGKIFEAMANSPRINMVQPGRGFPLNQFGRRPDEQNPAVDIVQAVRVRSEYGDAYSAIPDKVLEELVPDERVRHAVKIHVLESADFNAIGDQLGIDWKTAMLMTKVGLKRIVAHIETQTAAAA